MKKLLIIIGFSLVIAGSYYWLKYRPSKISEMCWNEAYGDIGEICKEEPSNTPELSACDNPNLQREYEYCLDKYGM